MIKKNLWISFCPIWILVNVLGWFVNTAILITPYFGWAIPLSAAFILGLLQFAILNKFLGVDLRWAFASMLAYGTLNYAFYLSSDLRLLVFLEVLILGLLGWLQYAILNEYINGATTWIFTSPIAGLFGLAVSYAVARSFPQAWAIQGMIYGIITGVMLVLLMNKPDKGIENILNDG
jgi:hypothetical protein